MTMRVDLPQFEPAGPPCEDPNCTGALTEYVDLRSQEWFQRCSKCGKEFNRTPAAKKLAEARRTIEYVLDGADD